MSTPSTFLAPPSTPPPPQNNKWSKIFNLFTTYWYRLCALFFIALAPYQRPSIYILVKFWGLDVFPQQVHEIPDELFHFPEEFNMDYLQMEKEFKIFMYPVEENDLSCYELLGKYASEGYFIKNLKESWFLTDDPNKAYLFFVPIPCHIWQSQGISNQIDEAKSIGMAIEDQVQKLISKYPYWNRTSGGDHFFVMCHDIPTMDVRRFMRLTKNSIRVVCSSHYSDDEYVPHKDVSLPKVTAPAVAVSLVNSIKNRDLILNWEFAERKLDVKNNSKGEALVNQIEFYESRYCLGPSSYSYRTIHYGCVPAFKTQYYDLPFSDIIDWHKFFVTVYEKTMGEQLNLLIQSDIEDREHFEFLHNNSVKVRKHFQWNSPPHRVDAFLLVIYELWQRRHVIKYSSTRASIRRHIRHRRKE